MDVHFASDAKRITCEKLGTSSSMRRGASARGDLKVNSYPFPISHINVLNQDKTKDPRQTSKSIEKHVIVILFLRLDNDQNGIASA